MYTTEQLKEQGSQSVIGFVENMSAGATKTKLQAQGTQASVALADSVKANAKPFSKSDLQAQGTQATLGVLANAAYTAAYSQADPQPTAETFSEGAYYKLVDGEYALANAFEADTTYFVKD